MNIGSLNRNPTNGKFISGNGSVDVINIIAICENKTIIISFVQEWINSKWLGEESAEEKVRKHFDEISALLLKNSADNNFQKAPRNQNIPQYLYLKSLN